jgi:hypothetical protein
MAVAIAEELFFHPSDFNWHDADWQTFLLQWSVASRQNYETQLQHRPGLSQIEFFVEDLTGHKGFKCSLDYEETCINAPSPEYIRQQHPETRHRARQIIYVMEAHRLALEQAKLVNQVIVSAKENLEG